MEMVNLGFDNEQDFGSRFIGPAGAFACAAVVR
jgi:hypothetical protein